MAAQGLIVSGSITEADADRVIEAGRRLGAEIVRRRVDDHAQFIAVLEEYPAASFMLADFLPDATADADSGISYAFSRVAVDDDLPPAVRETALRRVDAIRWIQLAAVGVNQEASSFVWREAPQIAITTASGLASVTMAQYVIAAILDHAHGFSRLASYRAARDWSVRRQFQSEVLVGKTLGLLGYGGVGARAAHIAHALGMRVIAVRRSADAPGGGPARYRLPAIEQLDAGFRAAEVWGIEELDRLLAQSDYLACTLPLTAATRGLIGKRELGLLPQGAFVINVSRGPIVDEPALIAALRSGRLSGAVLDVFETEPLPPDSPLWDLPNVLVTPHSSGTHDHVSDFTADLFIANMERFLAGRPLLNVADRTLGY